MNSRKKRLRSKFFVLILLFSIGCKDENDISELNSKALNREINKVTLFSGTLDSINNPQGFWGFYDKNKNPIFNLVIYKNTKTEFYYQIKQKNSSGKIVYFAEIRNGEVFDEYDYETLQSINIDNGNFLYKNYCFNCHNYNKEGIAKSLLQMRNIEMERFIKQYNNKIFHDSLPKNNNNELKSIYKYMKSF